MAGFCYSECAQKNFSDTIKECVAYCNILEYSVGIICSISWSIVLAISWSIVKAGTIKCDVVHIDWSSGFGIAIFLYQIKSKEASFILSLIDRNSEMQS